MRPKTLGWIAAMIGIAAVAGLAYLGLGRPAREFPPTRSTCRSGLRNLGFALELYAQDYDDRLPPAERWQAAIEPYHRAPERAGCPAVGGRLGYAFNSGLAGRRAAFNAIQPPRPLLFDSANLAPSAADPLTSFVARHRVAGQAASGYVVYTDGLVRAHTTAPVELFKTQER